MASGEIRFSTTTMRQMPVLAQGTNSDSSLDYIVVTATKYNYDPATGITGITGSASSGYIPFANGVWIPFTNSPSFDPDRAYAAISASDAAYAAGNNAEAARQLDIYYQYCGCSSGGSPYANITPTAPPLSPGTAPPPLVLPPIQLPPIQP
jgi:hypothetical protein